MCHLKHLLSVGLVVATVLTATMGSIASAASIGSSSITATGPSGMTCDKTNVPAGGSVRCRYVDPNSGSETYTLIIGGSSYENDVVTGTREYIGGTWYQNLTVYPDRKASGYGQICAQGSGFSTCARFYVTPF